MVFLFLNKARVMVKLLQKHHYEKNYFNFVGGGRSQPSPPIDPPLPEMTYWVQLVWFLYFLLSDYHSFYLYYKYTLVVTSVWPWYRTNFAF